MISLHTAVNRFYEIVRKGDQKKIKFYIKYLERRGISNYWDKSVWAFVKTQKRILELKHDWP